MGAHMLPCLGCGGEDRPTCVANMGRCKEDPAPDMAAFPLFPKFSVKRLDSFLTGMGVLDVLFQFRLGLATVRAILAFIAQASPAANMLFVFCLAFEFFAASRASYRNGLRALSSIREGIRIVCHAQSYTRFRAQPA